jgi:iron complex transport system ATP-binding protein
MLEARDVWLSIGGNHLLAGVDLAVEPGRIVAVIGPNGAGKSSVVRVLSGELVPTRGRALLDGKPLRSLPAAEVARRRAVVPQTSALAFPFTVLEVVMLGVTVPGFRMPATAARAAAEDALEAVEMMPFADRIYATLSGGERQRVHIARALCQLAAAPTRPGETRCLLLDEPTASLDLAHQVRVLDILRRQAELGFAVLVVVHDLNLAASAADRIVLLSRGRVAAAGPPADVLQDGLLSEVYDCQVSIVRSTDDDRPLVLPPYAPLPAPVSAPQERAAIPAFAVHPLHR